MIQEGVNPTYLLAWLPETLLNEKGQTEWDKFVKIEERTAVDEEDTGPFLRLTSDCAGLTSLF